MAAPQLPHIIVELGDGFSTLFGIVTRSAIIILSGAPASSYQKAIPPQASSPTLWIAVIICFNSLSLGFFQVVGNYSKLLFITARAVRQETLWNKYSNGGVNFFFITSAGHLLKVMTGIISASMDCREHKLILL